MTRLFQVSYRVVSHVDGTEDLATVLVRARTSYAARRLGGRLLERRSPCSAFTVAAESVAYFARELSRIL